MKKTVRTTKLFPLLLLLLISTFARSAIFQTTGVGGLWNVGSTWVGGIPPSPTDDVEVYGDLYLNVNTSIDNITIFNGATFQNANSNSYTLDVLQDITNHGVIQDNSYSLYLNIFGNIIHDGTWQNYSTQLFGTGPQSINATQPFYCPVFQNNITAHTIDVTSNSLHFVGSAVNFGNCDVTFVNGTIVLDGGYFTGANITCNQMDITLNSGAYIQYFTCNSEYIWLRGTFKVGPNVVFNDNLSNVVVEVVDSLQNYNSNNVTLDVNGDLYNNGIIKNNSYSLYLNISGTLVNNGTWKNQTTNLTGTGNQLITFNQPFDGGYLTNTNTEGYLTATAMLVFNGTIFNLNNDTIYYGNSAGAVTFNGGYMNNFTMISNGTPNAVSIDLNSGAYFNSANLIFNEITLLNTFQFSNTMNFYGNVTVQGILQNYLTNNYTAHVYGDMNNNGLITNNSYDLSLYIDGDIWQNGTWNCLNTYFSGAADQNIYFNQDFDGNNLNNSNTNGKIITHTNLKLNNTFFEMNSDTLEFADAADSLILNGNYTQNAVLIREAAKVSGSLKFDLLNSAYVQNFNVFADEILLYGTFQFRSAMNFYGNVTVKDILRNYGDNNYTATFSANLVNEGSIVNNNYNLTVNINGDIWQKGIWSGYSTNLSGNGDQNFYVENDFDGAYLTNSNTNGKVILMTNLKLNNTFFEMNSDTLEFTNAADSITINGNYMRNATIIRQAAKASGNIKFNLVNGAYVENLNVFADEILLYGTYQFRNAMNFFGNVTVKDILRNNGDNNHTADFSANLVNEGSIVNNNYNLTVNINGDIWQQGIWSCNSTNLSGDNDQNLYIENDFDGAYLTNSNTNGKVILMTNLKLNNTFFEMNSDTLEFANAADSITINGNYMRNATIIRQAAKASGNIKFNLMNGAYVENLNVFADEILLYGTYQFRNAMNFFGNVTVKDILRNNGDNNHTADFSANLVNEGSIVNNNYNLTVNINGDIWQQGIWSCNSTNLSGDNDQNIYIENDFDGAYLTNSNTNGKVILMTNLKLNNTFFEMNSDTLEFANAADSITINENYMRNATIIRQAAKASGNIKFNLMNGAYVENLNVFADEILLYGTYQFRNAMNFFGNVTVKDILRNNGDNNYVASIYGNLTNQGSILNNSYILSLYISGDIWQNNLWACYYTYLNGSSAQTIHQTAPFSGSVFQDLDSGSDIISTTDLVFNNTDVNLGGANLLMPDNSILAIQDGYFINANISGNDIEFSMNSDYLENITMQSVTLFGSLQARNNVVFNGNVINNGILQNYDNNNYTVHVNGGLINNGTIKNLNYSLYLYVEEDILNNGTWDNTWTQLSGYDGAINQAVTLQNGHDITGQLRLYANNSSNFSWLKDNVSLIGNPSYSGANLQILQFLVPASATTTGIYNCSTAAGLSRNITINTTSFTAPEVDLKAVLEGPFNGTDMNTDLNDQGLLPLSQPYDTFPWNYFGTETVAAIPGPQVVDWVEIEFRDAVDGASATKATRFERQAAFILSDGSIVGMDGSSHLFLSKDIVSNLFVIVNHRNHLGVMSAVPLIETGGIYTYDFAYDTWNSYGGPNASKNVGTDLDPVYGLMGGEGNGDGQIDQADHVAWPATVGNRAGYELTDFNMDGQIDNQDKNDSWIENIGNSVQYPE